MNERKILDEVNGRSRESLSESSAANAIIRKYLGDSYDISRLPQEVRDEIVRLGGVEMNLTDEAADRRKFHVPARIFSMVDARNALGLYRRGVTIKKLAAMYGVSASTIQNRLHELVRRDGAMERDRAGRKPRIRLHRPGTMVIDRYDPDVIERIREDYEHCVRTDMVISDSDGNDGPVRKLVIRKTGPRMIVAEILEKYNLKHHELESIIVQCGFTRRQKKKGKKRRSVIGGSRGHWIRADEFTGGGADG